MTMYYMQIPTLEMRVAASPLIVIGVVGKVVDRQIDYYDHEPFVRSTYEVTVHEVLKGTLEQKVIRIEVMGGESQNVATPLRAPMHEGTPLVLILVPEADASKFVPYFNSAFPLNAEGQIALGPRAMETLSSKMAPIKGETIPLDMLRELIKTISETEAAETKEAEPLIRDKALPPVLERPQGFNGGGEPSKPQTAEQRER